MARARKTALILIYIFSGVALLFGHGLIIWAIYDSIKCHKFIAFGGITFLFLFFILFEIYVFSSEMENRSNKR